MEPDATARGFLKERPDPLRYGGSNQISDKEAPGIMHEMMPSGARVLDVGCGAANTTTIINGGKQNEILCVEPDIDRATAARNHGFTVYNGYFDPEFAGRHEPFDAIVFGDVLEHVPNPSDMLETAKKCLKPGGVIIVSVPNVAHWTVRLGLLMGRFDYRDSGIMDATHLRWFTKNTLSGLLAGQGFEVTEMRQSAGLWMPVYNSRPLNLLPAKLRRAAVLALLRAFPTLMGVQHVVSARVR